MILLSRFLMSVKQMHVELRILSTCFSSRWHRFTQVWLPFLRVLRSIGIFNSQLQDSTFCSKLAQDGQQTILELGYTIKTLCLIFVKVCFFYNNWSHWFLCLNSAFYTINWRYRMYQHSLFSSKHARLQTLILAIRRVERPLEKWLIKLVLVQGSRTTSSWECWNVKMHHCLIGK